MPSFSVCLSGIKIPFSSEGSTPPTLNTQSSLVPGVAISLDDITVVFRFPKSNLDNYMEILMGGGVFHCLSASTGGKTSVRAETKPVYSSSTHTGRFLFVRLHFRSVWKIKLHLFLVFFSIQAKNLPDHHERSLRLNGGSQT